MTGLPASQEATRSTRAHLPPGRVLAVAAVLALSVTVFTDLLAGVQGGNGLAAYDPQVTLRLTTARPTALLLLAQAVTALGSTPVLVALTVATVVWLWWRRSAHAAAVVVLVAMFVAAVATLLLKGWVARPRPPAGLQVGPNDTDYSFPSGHTLNSTVFYGLLAVVLIGHSVLSRYRAWVVAAAVVLVVAVGVSRVYLGYHWATDVLAGWSAGLAILSLTALAWLGSGQDSATGAEHATGPP